MRTAAAAKRPRQAASHARQDLGRAAREIREGQVRRTHHESGITPLPCGFAVLTRTAALRQPAISSVSHCCALPQSGGADFRSRYASAKDAKRIAESRATVDPNASALAHWRIQHHTIRGAWPTVALDPVTLGGWKATCWRNTYWISRLSDLSSILESFGQGANEDPFWAVAQKWNRAKLSLRQHFFGRTFPPRTNRRTASTIDE
jgi:hypothetical protein